MELSLLILVCIHKSYIVYLEIYVVPIGHGFSFFLSWKSHGKSMLKKRGHPVERSKVKVSRLLNGLMLWPKIGHIFGRGRPMRTSNLVYGWSTIIRVINMRGDLKGQSQGYNLSSSVDACLSITRQRSRRSTEIDRTVVHATGDIPHRFQVQKFKGQGHQVA